ncbi:luciferase-like monooxygenase [Ameyamaea chiangmaiensis NBRC 103196]|uniref:Luciferase-like monooxygenase n=1 Tax=Ameyamaea chiangmaiensis TaxID=442969 RepID=A0A850P7W5_9PROT|nr:LLM class flavin-dependent oxidoreductase [Ameyamaea chiangmaiensis]MBS4074291.1 LLM class flavin-dependent oxidoreductase [Ameyamaea chiangmaiensis]NVN40705.1 LLM class flavin-dependent oxidoreductase [Ameyamaea chiangmaiensis]GBQ71532.1 luciferase-like monooxygenase [Ameyamaea chiangmaiensis NBRC 103196]
MIPFSVLDLSLITSTGSPAEAFANSRDLARHAETLGFERYWVAEHHAMPGIASAATALLIQHIASATQTIRVGSGGIMLPNHSPLAIAEQFGTLETLFPGRIDLGLGRAPGSDQETVRALRRDAGSADRFPQDVVDLLAYLGPPQPGQRVVAVPGADTNVPVWLLGSSLFSAQLAAYLGLPFAFAAHFAPEQMEAALTLYRREFEPSRYRQTPHAMVCVNVIAADTDARAARLETSLRQYFVALRTGRPIAYPPPIDPETHAWSESEKALFAHALRFTFAGSPATVQAGLCGFISRYQPDELMIAAPIFDHGARRDSLSHAMAIRAALARA